MEDYAYRVYDEDAVRRLRQIIILRKLRVPVKQIREIFCNSDAVSVIEMFERNINELDKQITALSTVKSILSRLVSELHEKANMRLQLDYLGESAVFAIVDSLTFPKNTIQSGRSQSELPGHALEEENSMEDLNNANETLSKLEDKDVRIIYLPPMTVAAACASGEECEGKANGMIAQFVNESGLLKIKPDARSFGFDCSADEVKVGEPSRQYEAWVSVPDEMEVPAPLKKQSFSGGLYAAHVLRSWDFQDWGLLGEWINTSEKYESDVNPELQRRGMEETLNFYNFIQNGGKMEDLQLDLLGAIKEKAN
jgi:DNA-binding transcriptional MerR regulator/DNA gyrase inhibitor GyrI